MARVKPQTGWRVTCKYPVPELYSEYGGNPKMIFEPGMVGVIACISAKVRKYKPEHRPVWCDNDDYSAVVDYIDSDGVKRRTSLNFCNVVHLKDN